MHPRSWISLGLVAGVALATWWLWSTGLRTDKNARSAGISPGGTTPEERSSSADLMPESPYPDEGRRVEGQEGARARADAAQTGTAPNTSAIPDDALWVDCRLLPPDGMPADEELFVEARGREFESGGLSGQRIHRSRVEGGGVFQVAFAAGTRRGRLSLKGRYLYLDRTLRVNVPEAEGSGIAIEPRLGGLIRGQVLPPAAMNPEEIGLGEVVIAFNATGPGMHTVQNADVDEAGQFELPRLIPGAYQVEARSERFANAERDVRVVAGEPTRLELALTRGIRVRGRVVGVDGRGIADPEVTIRSVDQRHGNHTVSERASPRVAEGEGYFERRGVPAGQITVEVEREGYLAEELELGEQIDGAAIEELRIELGEGLTIEGQVRWPDGTPVALADVRVTELGSPRKPFAFGPSGLPLQTDSEGRFRAGGLHEGSVKVSASATRWEPAEVGGDARAGPGSRWSAEIREVRAGTNDLLLVLGPGLSLAGRVVDDTGAPLGFFRIRAVPDRGDLFTGLAGLSGEAVSESFRAEDGRFVLEGLTPGDWRIEASARQHARSAPHPLTLPHQGPALELMVPRLATIRGEVRDPGGAPVADARVTLQKQHRPASIVFGTADAGARTDPDGSFELKRVDPGEVTLTASDAVLGSSDPLPVQVPPGGDLEGLMLVLRVPARILGRVDSAAGSIAGRSIRLRRGAGGYTESLVSDDSGGFLAEGLTPGAYVLYLEPEEEAPKDEAGMLRYFASTIEEHVELGEGETKHVVLGAPPDHPIQVRGRVTSAGEPQAGQLVTCVSANETSAPDRASAHCDEAGRYTLTLEAPGEYNFSIGSQWGDQLTILRTIPDRELVTMDFELPAGRLAGRVRTPGGAPARSCPVTLERATGEAEESWSVAQFSTTGPDGTFRFDHLPGGSYVLRVGGSLQWQLQASDEVFGLQRLDGLQLAPGQVKDDLLIDLRLAGSIEGRVLAPDGSPAPGATIVPVNDSSPFATWNASQSGTNGRFKYRGLSAGRVVIQARLGELVSEPMEVRVVEGESVEVVLQLEE